MAKSNKRSTEHLYELGEEYLASAREELTQAKDKFIMAGTFFWHSLVLGNAKAAYHLYELFSNGWGVEKNDYIAALMFGISLRIGDERCQEITTNITIETHSQIDHILKLIKKAQSEIPLYNVSMNILDKQIEIFNEAIELPCKNEIIDYLDDIFITPNVSPDMGDLEVCQTNIENNQVPPIGQQAYTPDTTNGCCLLS